MDKLIFYCIIMFVSFSACILERVYLFNGEEVPFWIHGVNGLLGLAAATVVVLGWAWLRGSP